jgi:hypothetical protein
MNKNTGNRGECIFLLPLPSPLSRRNPNRLLAGMRMRRGRETAIGSKHRLDDYNLQRAVH